MALAYVLFFLSGAAGLVYEVVWARSLGLVFGASHLAVTTVLAVYMAGLALGATLLGRRADAARRPLRLYGLLELGIAAFAVLFIGLIEIYPTLYRPLVRLGPDLRLYRTALRVVFGGVAMLGPTTLMGGTLPVLARFAAQRGGALGRQLSFLYAINTLGAVAGSLAAGFVLLPTLGVTRTLLATAATGVLLGLAALSLDRRAAYGPAAAPAPAPAPVTPGGAAAGPELLGDASRRLVLWGVGVSGFCALGYEVLWTRMLTLVVGTSVYSFTIMLVAFLAGIALGSYVYGLAQLWLPARGPRRGALSFGAVQVAIGASAFAVTALMRDLPSYATALQSAFVGDAGEFGGRQAASFVVAFAFLFVPAFLGGVAFPQAGAILAAGRARVGESVGAVYTFNTVGAILGASTSGFLLIYAFGAERSLQMLTLLNVGIGIALAASLLRWRGAWWAVGAATVAVLVARGVDADRGRFWDQEYFATFRNNQRAAFDTPEEVREALEHTDVLYYFEGPNETISVIRPKGARQGFIVNGRPEATTASADVQCQRTLGHLPMLLHPRPRSVFVLGTGTGMTLGATSIHPGVERLVLAEIEPGVLPATRTFARWNHNVLDDPRLRVVFEDGRSFLATTSERFDVITADPIHPWSGGAAYLYTKEYFDAVARRLAPGGIATQWLPIYELTVHDVRTVVRTFAGSFRHVLVWLTHYDAELVGSNDPIVIDEDELARRFANPAIARDLEEVFMGTPTDFLSYFVLGTDGARAFGSGGVVNTDDNLFLEFSAPRSQGIAPLMGLNVQALTAARASLLPYLVPAAGERERAAQVERWTTRLAAARACDRAHALFLGPGRSSPELAAALRALEERFPWYAPYRFLRRRVGREEAATPTLVARDAFRVHEPNGDTRTLWLSAVTQRIGDERAVISFVDNERRRVFGERYVDASPDRLPPTVARIAADVLAAARLACGAPPGRPPPSEDDTAACIERAVERATSP